MILLTGASGFIGTHLLESLITKFGYENVVVLTSRETDECRFLLHNDYTFTPDYFVTNGYGEIDTIIHAGAFTPKNPLQANIWNHCNSNVVNTAALLRSELPKLKKFVYLSTLDVYANATVINEDSVVNPSTLYGLSKYYCEKMIQAWGESENRLIHIARVGHVYGPGEQSYEKVIPASIFKLLNDEKLQIWGTGEELRSFIFVEDVVASLLNLCSLDYDIGPINIVSGRSISILSLLTLLTKVSGINSQIEIIPTPYLGRDLRFDVSKIRKFLLPKETPLEVGLKKEIEYMKALR